MAVFGWLCLTSGGAAAQVFAESPHAVPMVLPACDPGDPAVRIIDSVDDWSAVNDPAARVFCVRPGNYAAAGTIRLTRSGMPGQPRVLRHHDPSRGELFDPAFHPVRIGRSRRAILSGLEIKGVDHWLVHGIAIQDSPGHALVVRNADHVVLDRLLVQDAARKLVEIGGTSSHDVLQNSVIRNSAVVYDGGRLCVLLSNPGAGAEQRDNRIVQNELYDCTDGIQVHRSDDDGPAGFFPGLVIEENDIYLTPARYTDCRGNFDRSGPCGCAENGIDVKIAGTGVSPEQSVSITSNRIWGWRESDHGPARDDRLRCGNNGSWGDLIVVHRQSQYLSIHGNRLFDGPRGVVLSGGVRHVTVTENVLHGIDDGVQQPGLAIGIGGSDFEIRRNVVAEGHAWLGFLTDHVRDTVIRCNVVVDSTAASGKPARRTRIDHNAYYGTDPRGNAGIDYVLKSTAAEAPGGRLCFWRKRWTVPEQVCLSHGTWAVGPELAAACPAPTAAPAQRAPEPPRLIQP